MKDNIQSLVSLGNEEKFLSEAKSYSGSNLLSQMVVESIEAKRSDKTGRVNTLSLMGSKLLENSTKSIKGLMKKDYESLSEDQKLEIARLESRANRETNLDKKKTALGEAMTLAQQYLQQNQANKTGEGGSKSLPAVMTEISQGITTFNDTMTQLKNALSNQGSTMTITLNK